MLIDCGFLQETALRCVRQQMWESRLIRFIYLLCFLYLLLLLLLMAVNCGAMYVRGFRKRRPSCRTCLLFINYLLIFSVVIVIVTTLLLPLSVVVPLANKLELTTSIVA